MEKSITEKKTKTIERRQQTSFTKINLMRGRDDTKRRKGNFFNLKKRTTTINRFNSKHLFFCVLVCKSNLQPQKNIKSHFIAEISSQPQTSPVNIFIKINLSYVSLWYVVVMLFKLCIYHFINKIIIWINKHWSMYCIRMPSINNHKLSELTLLNLHWCMYHWCMYHWMYHRFNNGTMDNRFQPLF